MRRWQQPASSSRSRKLSNRGALNWKEALKSGWVYEPKFQFYTREVLLGIIICMAQIPESIAFAYLARVHPPVALTRRG